MNYACESPIGDKSAVSPIDIKGVESGSGYKITMSWRKGVSSSPAEARVGDEVEIVWKFVRAASKNPDVLDLDKETVRPTGVLKAAGARTGDVAMEGPRQNPPVPRNSDMPLSGMKGKLRLTAPTEGGGGPGTPTPTPTPTPTVSESPTPSGTPTPAP